MTVSISDEFQSFDQRAVIKVCGIGGGGGNAVTRMIEAGLSDVDFIAINTDAQALKNSPAGTRLQVGVELTGGLGSGAQPGVGARAAEEDRERIKEVLGGADMVFLTAGLGGGTGTGASPIVAQEATSNGALTVAIVTLPFSFEGKERMNLALRGLAELEKHVDTLIVVPNDRVATLCQNNMSLLNAFKNADEVLHNGVRAISELITIPGLINLDFADVRTIMQARGRALMGIGTAEGEDRAIRAAQEAIVCPLLEQSNINGAMGVIVNIKGGCDIGMREVQEAVTAVKDSAHPDANIIFGAVVDEQERPELQVTVIAAGFPKGVSEEFLSSDGKKTYLASVPPPLPDRERRKTVRKEEKPAAALAAEEKSAPMPAPPEEQFLFPDESTRSKPAAPEPDEDLGIPAFLRNRMKKKNK
ncbi:MAG: cell division protein FtsZ [Candidatus Hydrogenedentes bacterium]|nr:cell division protein FtsZ [Candidatus Hydrogenedentota bacterium]